MRNLFNLSAAAIIAAAAGIARGRPPSILDDDAISTNRTPPTVRETQIRESARAYARNKAVAAAAEDRVRLAQQKRERQAARQAKGMR